MRFLQRYYLSICNLLYFGFSCKYEVGVIKIVNYNVTKLKVGNEVVNQYYAKLYFLRQFLLSLDQYIHLLSTSYTARDN